MSATGSVGEMGGQRATARVVLIAAAAALGGFLFGMDTAVINGAVDAVRAGFGLAACAPCRWRRCCWR